LGAYLTTLGYHRLTLKDLGSHQIVTLLGASAIYLPSFFLAFGPDPALHALVLLSVGTGYVLSGIGHNHRFYRLLGITGLVLSILPQTYTYLLNLPRWVTLAILGIFFISGALYLLLRRPAPKS
jgi:hypothetical protein